MQTQDHLQFPFKHKHIKSTGDSETFHFFLRQGVRALPSQVPEAAGLALFSGSHARRVPLPAKLPCFLPPVFSYQR